MTGRRPRGAAKANAQKQSCDRGHRFTDANTYRWVDSHGYNHRRCRACDAIAAVARRRQASKPAGNRGNAATCDDRTPATANQQRTA